ncbi:MAG: LamG domain-containing protein [Syntrophorhabdaceae bacterium]|nr:LamG domain-containing protein [Syntrophorhabdaceae bacterium]
MSQHDFEITTADANTGIPMRAAINAAFQALASLSSGTTEPVTPYAYQLWADSGNDLLKIRTAANDGWVTIGTLSEIYLGLASLSAQNDFTASQKLNGNALLLRFRDSGASGEEWAIRSDGGNFEVVKNTGTEGSPTWTVQVRIDVNALRVGDGTAADIRLIANNAAANKPEIRYSNTGSKWQYSNDGSSFSDLGIEASAGCVPVRQTVLSSSVDASGYANFISIGSGLAVDIDGTPTPVRIAFAAGFGANGALNYVGTIDSDTSISSLAPISTNFLYAERDSSTGALSFGKTSYNPLYLPSYNSGHYQGAILSSFDGDNGASTFTDIHGNTWTGNATYATIKNDQSKWGTCSAFNTRNESVSWYTPAPPAAMASPWTVEFWFRSQSDGGTSLVLFGESYRVVLVRNTSNKLQLFVSSNGSAWTIADGTGAGLGLATVTTNAWHHIAMIWTGETYQVYVNGTIDISVTSSSPAYPFSNFYLGFPNSQTHGGWYSDFRFSPYARYTANFTAPTGALSVDTTMHYFNTSEQKMYEGYYGNWTEKQIVFLGEALTDASSVTGVVNYALSGKYDSGEMVTTATATSKNHNIGVNVVKTTLFESVGTRKQMMSKDFSITRNSVAWQAAADVSRLIVERGF